MGSVFKVIFKIAAECVEAVFGWFVVQWTKATIQGVFILALIFAAIILILVIIYVIGNKDRF